MCDGCPDAHDFSATAKRGRGGGSGYRSCALVCTLATILDELVAIEVPDLLFTEVALQRRECRRLGSRGVVSLRRTYRLYADQPGHRKCAGGPRTIGWAAAPERPGSRLGAPISGRRHGVRGVSLA